MENNQTTLDTTLTLERAITLRCLLAVCDALTPEQRQLVGASLLKQSKSLTDADQSNFSAALGAILQAIGHTIQGSIDTGLSLLASLRNAGFEPKPDPDGNS